MHFNACFNDPIMREFYEHQPHVTTSIEHEKIVTRNEYQVSRKYKNLSLLLFTRPMWVTGNKSLDVSRFLLFHWFWKWNTHYLCVARPETYYLVFPNLIDYDIGVTLFTCCLRLDSIDCDQSRKRIFSECFRMNKEYILERKGNFVENNNPISSS